MSVRREDVVMSIRSTLASMGVVPTDAEVNTAMAQIDLGALEADVRKRIRVERWKGEPIAGIDLYNHPNPLLREQYRRVIDAGGVIYKIYIDDRLVILQYHNPFKGGIEPISEADFEAVSTRHVDIVVRDMVIAEATRRGVQAILAGRGL